MKKSLLLISAIIFSISFTYSQSQVIFDKVENRSYLIRYNQSDNSVKKTIFNKLAGSYRIPVSNLRVNFNFKEKSEILKRGNKLDFIVTFSEIKLTGHTKYKNFDVSNSLIPKKLSFTLQWFNGQNLQSEYNFNDVVVSGNQVEVVNMNVTDSTNNSQNKIVIKNLVFSYSVKNQHSFSSETGSISRYYNDVTEANNKLKRLNETNVERKYLLRSNNFDFLNAYKDSAVSALNFVTDVRKDSYFRNLNVAGNDPDDLKSKLNSIKNRATLIENTCNEILQNLDKIYYEKGMNQIVINKLNMAEISFKESVKINSNYGPSHFQLAKLFYQKGDIDRSVNKIFEIRGMNPDQQTKTQTVEFAKGIYNDFLLDAGDLNNQGRFDDAIFVIDKASKICRDFPEVQCRSSMDYQMSRAFNGKFNLILRDVDINLKNNNLDESEKFINEALNFAEANRQFIKDNSLVAKRISNLYFKYVDQGHYFNTQKNYDNALTEFNQARRVCNTYPEINCTNELSDGYSKARTGKYNYFIYLAEQSFRSGNNAEAEGLIESAVYYREKFQLIKSTKENKLFLDIKQSVYTEFIAKGRAFHKAGEPGKALLSYDDAKQIENNFSIRKNSYLKRYMNESAKSLILSYLDAGKEKVKYNDLTNARKFYKDAKSLIDKYVLESDRTISSAMKSLKDQIFKQECVNAQNKYNSIFLQANDLIKDKKFIAADDKLSEALKYTESVADCELDTRELLDVRNHISSAVTYSRKMADIDKLINRGSYKKAIEEYQSNGTFFNSRNISKFGLTHASLFDYIKEGKVNLTIYGVGFYTYNKEFDNALDLLKELERRHTKNKYTQDEQVNLGRELANFDYQQNSNSNYKSNIARHTSNSKFFKYFMKAYKKQWKLLD